MSRRPDLVLFAVSFVMTLVLAYADGSAWRWLTVLSTDTHYGAAAVRLDGLQAAMLIGLALGHVGFGALLVGLVLDVRARRARSAKREDGSTRTLRVAFINSKGEDIRLSAPSGPPLPPKPVAYTSRVSAVREAIRRRA